MVAFVYLEDPHPGEPRENLSVIILLNVNLLKCVFIVYRWAFLVLINANLLNPNSN